MVLSYKGYRELTELIRFPYYMWNNNKVPHITIYQLSDWSDEVEIHIYYNGGSVYFDDEKDLVLFQLRWC